MQRCEKWGGHHSGRPAEVWRGRRDSRGKDAELRSRKEGVYIAVVYMEVKGEGYWAPREQNR